MSFNPRSKPPCLSSTLPHLINFSPPASSTTSSPRTERIYPDLQDLPPSKISEADVNIPGILDVASSARSFQDPSSQKSKPTRLPESSPRPPSVQKREGTPQVEKRMLKRKVPDEDPFTDGTPPSSPTPDRRLATRKALPILNEGPFGNRYVRTRTSTENEAAAVWPPNRKHKGIDEPPKAPVSKETAIHQQHNAIASSSKVKLPASTALRPNDPLLIGTAMQNLAGQVPISKTDGLLATSKPQAIATSVRPEKTSERSRAVGVEQPPAKKQKVAHSVVTHQEPAQSTVARTAGNFQDNPFPDKERPTTRRIDLRANLRKKHLRSGRVSHLSSRSSPASISKSISNVASRRDSVVSTASHRRQSVQNEEDIELMSLFERDLARLGEQYGFALGVVKQTYLQFGSLEKTVLVLRTLNGYMKSAQDRVYEDMQRLFNGKDQAQDSDDGELIPEGVIPKATSTIGKGKEREDEDGENNSSPSNKRHRQSLNYVPITTDVEEQSEYSPPSRTRAKRYAKLQKEGREEEVSTASLGPTPAQSPIGFALQEDNNVSRRDIQRRPTTVRRGREPSSSLAPDSEVSATPDDDEPVEMRQAELEEEEEDENDLMILSSECEPAPEIDDEEHRLKAEHKKLSSEATLKNHDALRAFEEGQVSGHWKGWSWELVNERLDVLKSAQEVRRWQLETAKKTKEAGRGGADESMIH